MSSLQRIAIVATLGVIGCAREAPPAPVVIERERVVYVPELQAFDRQPPGEPIEESPLLVEAARLRAEHDERLAANEHREPEVVYAPTPAAAVVIVRDLPPSQRKHTRWYYDRAAERCERRATKWARERCLRGVVR